MIQVPDEATKELSASSGQEPGVKRLSVLPTVAFALLLSALIFAAYANTIFNFFLGDDYGLLVWLREAVRNPDLLVKDFHGSWLGSPTAQFYRPFISVTVLSDFFLFGRDATGYHVTNILFLVAPAICLYFIVRSLAGPKLLAKMPLWPALAALLFGLYPLHSETVAWITGRVDSVVTAFYIASVLAYLRWRETKSNWYFAVAFVFMALSLFSKEMSIIIPATLAAYELFVGPSGEQRTPLPRVKDAALKTSPLWLLLAGYFVLRKYSLGTFVGGYDDSPLFMVDWATVSYNWSHGLRALVIPANQELMGAKNLLVILWQVCLVPAAVLLIASLREPLLRSRLFFLLTWAVLSLAPVYKLFNISNNLQASRYGYLTSVPLCCLLTAGLAWFIQICLSKSAQAPLSRAGLILSSTVTVVMIAVSFGMLNVNNSAWALAGNTCNAIQSQLKAFYDATPGDPPVMLLNMPDHLHGAYICRNAVEGMTQSPQISRDIHNCSIINQFDRLEPFGYLKESLVKNQDQVRILTWYQNKQVLQPIKLSGADLSETQPLVLTGDKLAQAAAPNRDTCTVAKDADSVLITPTRGSRRSQVEITLPGGLPCFSTDFIAVELQPESEPIEQKVDLEFTNRIFEEFDSSDLIRAFLKTPAASAKQTILFSLRSHPTWSLGGQAGKLLLRLPLGSNYRLLSVRSIPAREIMPIISFPKSDCLGSKGIAYFADYDEMPLSYDAGKVSGAAGIELETTRRNAAFQWPNSADDEGAAVLKHQAGAQGTINLKRSDFKDKGLFELRCRAVDKTGKRVGVAGDHFVVFLTK